MKAYKWPIYCFISVAFWNFLGTGIFGFVINPPIALYYMQGLNTTPVHGHAALFGVYEPILQFFSWLRVIGDAVFALGAVVLAIFVIGLKTGLSVDKSKVDIP